MKWSKAFAALLFVGAWGLACTGDGTSPSNLDNDWKPPLVVSLDLQPGDVGQCMGDDAVSYPQNVSGFGTNPLAFNCTANDISLANARTGTGSPVQCVQGEIITSLIKVDIEESANSARTDIGIWIGNNGNLSAETGECVYFFLDPLTTAGVVDVDGDLCGDMNAGGTVTDFDLTNLSLVCNDPDGDGLLEIPSCVSWTQPGGDRVCPDDGDGNGVPGQITDFRGSSLPANKSKCNCEPFFVEIEVQAQLTLEKEVINDDGGTAVETDWTLTADGPTTPITGTEGEAAITMVQVQPGDYTLSESGGPSGYTAGNWSCTAGTLAGNVLTLGSGDNATCVITNDDDPAFLTLNKVVVNDDGGTAVVNDFQAKIDGGNVPWAVAQSVGAGTFTASETVVAGYSAGTWGGDCAADGSVTLANGESKSCTITNDDQPATLTLNKTVVNDDGGTAVINDFQAKIDGADVPWGAPQGVGAGSFTASETVVAGYTAGSWGGDCAADGSVTLANGDDKVCSITNDDDPAFLTLNKVVVNDDGGTAVVNDFQAKIDGGNVPWAVAQSVGAGTFTASETVVAGYSAGTWGGDCAADGSVTLANGESKSCTITNDDQPATLTLNKTVVNDDGGTAVINDFQAKIDGADVPWGAPQGVGAGSFTASETVVAGYTAGSWGGDCAADGSVTLALGENKVCSITNDDDPAFLTLNKVVVNDDGGTAVVNDFQAKIDGVDVPWAVAQSVGAGSFAASETVVAGYSAGTWGGDCAADGSVTLALGESKTCTITNDDQPATLTLNKTVTNDHGGTAVINDFQAMIDGGNVPWGAAQSIGAGSFTASETVVAGYTAGTWTGDCAADGSVSLALGENKVCSINNNDDPAHLTLVKQVTNDNGGTAVATDWLLAAAGPTPISGPGGADSDVSAGTYTLSESGGPADYTPGPWVCVGGTQNGNQVSLGLGESATCTIINDDPITLCALGDRVTSVTLEVITASSTPISIVAFEKQGQVSTGVIITDLIGDHTTAVLGDIFRVDPLGGAANFKTQNLRFLIDGVESKDLKVHLSCSDDPQVGDTHSGGANGKSVTLQKVSFITAPKAN